MAKVCFRVDGMTLRVVRQMATWHNTSLAEQLRSLIEWGIESARERPTQRKVQLPRRINVDQARKLYQQHKSWRIVSDKMPRRDGTKYHPSSINIAVRKRDRIEGAQT